MAITPVSKAQAMRPAEIAAIDALNLAIEQLNQIDVSGLNTRLANIETSITNINSRLDTIDTSITDLTDLVDAISSDVDDIKITLYTPLNQNV